MVDTGNGAKGAVKRDAQSTAANSSNLAAHDKRSTTPAKHDALEILQSAIKVCRDAGLNVRISAIKGNANGNVLIIGLPNVAINGNDEIIEVIA